MVITDIRFVDLGASDVDWTQSDKASGKYVFRKKVYVDYQGITAPRPNILIKWQVNEEGAIQDWKNKWEGAEILTTSDDFWPEGIVPHSDGTYVYKNRDILMKIPLLAWIRQRQKEISKSERAAKNVIAIAHAELKGQGADVSEEQLAEILGIQA